MSYSNQTIFLSKEIMDQINREAGTLMAAQGTWDKQNIVDGMKSLAWHVLLGKYEATIASVQTPEQRTTAVENVLRNIINSDQGPYEKLHNIKALLEDK